MLLSLVLGCLLIVVAFTLHFLYLYLKLRLQVRLLSEEIRLQQKLMEKAFASIHNCPLQVLAFLIRELQSREISQQELIQYLRDVYQDVQTGVQNLQERE